MKTVPRDHRDDGCAVRIVVVLAGLAALTVLFVVVAVALVGGVS